MRLPRQGDEVQNKCLGSYSVETNRKVNLNFTPRFNSYARFARRAFVIRIAT